jgi:hypothetical protein
MIRGMFLGKIGRWLFKLNAKLQQIEPIPYNKGANDLPIKTLYFDKQKRLLIGTDGCGLKNLQQGKKSNRGF